MQTTPRAQDIDLATWNWKAVRQFVGERTQRWLSRPTCLRYLHRLDFRWKRPKKRLLKADAAKRAAFVQAYQALLVEAAETGATILFVDEAHFRADADLRGCWVQRGMPALVDSTSPKRGEKANYYSAVCPATGAVTAMAFEGNSSATTSVACLQQLRATYPGPLHIIWDNGPAHGGDAMREYLRTRDLNLHLIRLPAYSPDYNADEPIWGWVREEVTGNTCFGTAEKVRAAVDAFFAGLAARRDEVKRRCRTRLDAEATALPAM